MEKRRFGSTNHESTIAIFGAAAFYETSQKQADKTMELVLSRGVNHIDVAPSYGQAEKYLKPWMKAERKRFFLGCKTKERKKQPAYDELRRSLDTLGTDSFDLYQFHEVNDLTELDQITGPGGALEGVLKGKEEGLLKYIGITGHGLKVPEVQYAALQRFDFDSVLFPVNFILYNNSTYRNSTEKLLALCSKRDVGVMAIKSIAKGPWGDKEKTNTTWYQPFTDKEWINKAVHFTLSQKITGICTAADISLLPMVLDACDSFTGLSPRECDDLIDQANNFEPLFT